MHIVRLEMKFLKKSVTGVVGCHGPALAVMGSQTAERYADERCAVMQEFQKIRVFRIVDII